MSIWEILGIEPSASVEDIRAAYSEKVKLHHPEDDPEGFMRVREAYKAAIRSQSRPSPFPSSAPEPSASRPQPPRETATAPGFDFAHLDVNEAEPAADTPPPPDFDFSNIKGQTPPETTAPPPSSPPDFDFSQVKGQKPPETTAPPPPDFDFSQIKGQKPPETTPPPPDFDFSQLEDDADQQLLEERQFAHNFFAGAMALYRSRQRGKPALWKAMFGRSDLRKPMRGEAFTWAFLDFVAITPAIPNKVRTQVIDPFTAELKAFWQGTELWAEFDVAAQKYISKGLKKARTTFFVQLGLIALPILVFISLLTASALYSGTFPNTPMGFVQTQHSFQLLFFFSTLLATVCGIGAQLICHLIIRGTVNRGVSGLSRISISRFTLILVSVALALFCYGLAPSAFQEASEAAEDLRQIEENRLEDVVVYFYKKFDYNGNYKIFHASSADKEKSTFNEYCKVMNSLGFEPNTEDLLNADYSIPKNYENGMKDYRITYTNNLLVIMSIEEVTP